MLSKGLSRVFSDSTIRKHQFFSTQPSLRSNSYICTLTIGKTIALTLWTFVGKVMSPLHKGSEASETTKRDEPHQPLWLGFYRCVGPGGPQGNRRQAVPTGSGSTANTAFSLHATTSTGQRADGSGRMCMPTWASPFSFIK